MLKTSKNTDFKIQPGEYGIGVGGSKTERDGSRFDRSRIDNGEIDGSEIGDEKVGKKV